MDIYKEGFLEVDGLDTPQPVNIPMRDRFVRKLNDILEITGLVIVGVPLFSLFGLMVLWRVVWDE